MFKTTGLALTFSVGLLSTAFAGDQYVDGTGFSVSGYDVTSYFGLVQSTVGEAEASPLPGRSSIIAEDNGAVFAFATKANRDRFLANPKAFVPQHDGHCAHGVATGGKVPGNATLWRIVDDKLYLNITKSVVGVCEKDIPGNLVKPESNWSGIEEAAASTDVIQSFHPSAPVAN